MSKTDTNTVLYQGQCINYSAGKEGVEYQRSDYVIRTNTRPDEGNGHSVKSETGTSFEILFISRFLQADALKALKMFENAIDGLPSSGIPQILTWNACEGVKAHDWIIEIKNDQNVFVDELDTFCFSPDVANFACLAISKHKPKKSLLKDLKHIRKDIKQNGLEVGRWRTPYEGVTIRSVKDLIEFCPWWPEHSACPIARDFEDTHLGQHVL